MTKRQKLLGILNLIYMFVLLFIIGLMFGLAVKGKTENLLWIALIFIMFAILGYVFITCFKLKSIVYICPKCNKEKHLKFGEYLFASKVAEGRLIKCECSEEEVLPHTRYIDEK